MNMRKFYCENCKTTFEEDQSKFRIDDDTKRKYRACPHCMNVNITEVFDEPKPTYSGESYIIEHVTRGLYVYGECEGSGTDFDSAYQFSDFEGASRFLNHNCKYDMLEWNIRRVKITYEIE